MFIVKKSEETVAVLELLSVVVYTVINSNGVVDRICPMTSRVSAVSQEERLPPEERFCPHCNEYMSKATFFHYRLLYYDHLANKWQTSTLL